MEAAQRTKTLFQTKVSAELWLNLAGKDYRLVGKTIRLGRAPDNDIVLDDKSVSRYHSILTILPDQIILEDLKSRNGTAVNSAKIRRAELKDSDEIQIGDLKGIFYQKQKKAASQKSELKSISLKISGIRDQASFIKEKFQGLDRRKQFFIVGGIVLFLFVLAMMSSSAPQPQVSEANASAQDESVVPGQASRVELERCREFEDLGSFRRAISCLKDMPLTAEVNDSIGRIRKRQEQLTEKRYLEGKQAFENYYYDVAVQKWQEVLLVADDDSKYWSMAQQGIVEAEKLRGQR